MHHWALAIAGRNSDQESQCWRPYRSQGLIWLKHCQCGHALRGRVIIWLVRVSIWRRRTLELQGWDKITLRTQCRRGCAVARGLLLGSPRCVRSAWVHYIKIIWTTDSENSDGHLPTGAKSGGLWGQGANWGHGERSAGSICTINSEACSICSDSCAYSRFIQYFCLLTFTY